MLKRYPFIAILLTCLPLACAVGEAQEVSPEATSEVADESKPKETIPPRPAQIDRIPLIDNEDGDLILKPVPLNEYYEMRDKALGVSREQGMRDYQILSLIATGKVTNKGDGPFDKGRADLSVKLKVAVEKEREGWMRIPLRFGQAALKTVPTNSDLGRYRVDFEIAEDGVAKTSRRGDYVLWLYGRGKGTTEDVALDFSLPLSGIGQENRLLLSVPNAAMTELTVTVPMLDAVGNVSGGADLQQVKNGPSATDLVVRGFQGDIDLRWHKPDGDTTQTAPVLSADGMIKALVVGRRVEFDADLIVDVLRPPGRQLDQFEVRLPPGAVLSEESFPNYTVTDISPPDLKPGEGRLVLVALREPAASQETAVVTLRAASGAEAALDGQFSLAGFEVSNAVRQTGQVRVSTRGDWVVRCDAGRGATQTSEGPEGTEAEDVLATYDYVQPFTLSARVFPRQERISVEPRYDLSIESHVARLVADLKYTVRGKKAVQLKIDLNGWEFDQVGPESLVMACEADDSGVLVISLQEGTLGEFQLTLSAHRSVDSSKASLVLPLPKPHANSLSSTALIVLPADNIDLREDHERTEGLERQKVPPPSASDLPDIQQEPLYYRGETGEVGELVFAGLIGVREQEITAEVSTDVAITSTDATVKERLIYDVKYEPVSVLTIQVPQDLSVEYSLDGDVVDALPTDEPAGDGDSVRRRIVLPSPRQGRLELTAAYTIPIGDLEPLASVPCVIPLIVPVDAVFSGHRLRTTLERGIGIWRGRGSPWQVRSDEIRFGSETVTEFTAETPEDRIVIGVLQKDPDTLGSAVVHMAWVQTWITDSQRLDRAVYRFVSDRGHLKIWLPLEADSLLQVLLDGEEVEPDVTDESVTVTLAPEQNPRPHVLELQYLCRSRPSRGRMNVSLPRLADDVWVRRAYWQLVLPASEHIVSAPRDFTAEYDWAWTGAWWGRVPCLEQADLEKRLGAVSDKPIPEGTSRYLFSKFGPAESVEFSTASRTWIVGGASALALLLGLLLIYVPALRHPFFGLLFVVGAAGSAVIWSGPSLLFAQAAGMGVLLALLGAILYRGVARRRRRSVRRDVSSSVFERGSTQAQFGSSEVEVLRSTATEPDAAAVQAPER